MSKIKRNSKDGPEDTTFYKLKIKDLEKEISSLKQRLNDLRRAKNSVMIKREREIVHVGHPQVNRSQPSKPTSEVNNDGNKNIIKKLRETESLNAELEKKLKELKEQKSLLNKDLEKERKLSSTHKNQVKSLLEKLELKSTQEENKNVENNDRESHITDLTNENAELRAKNTKLVDDLSVKEAKWLEKEQFFHRKELQLQEAWSSKYAKWMTDTEQKIDDLKKQNDMLRDCINRGLPKNSKK